MFQVPEQQEYDRVRCTQEATKHCDMVTKQVCNTEVVKKNVTYNEDVQKCKDRPEEICRDVTERVPVTTVEEQLQCDPVPFEVSSCHIHLEFKLADVRAA